MQFNSFFMAGFECADHINRSGIRINLLKETEHDSRVFEDYQLLADLDIKVVREGVCWSAVETAPYTFDFTGLDKFFAAADRYGFQIIWDLCHFGYPDGLIPTHPNFCERFQAFCQAFALYHARMTTDPLLVVPINEISFLSWHSGDMRGTVPFAIHSGFDIKYHLCKAAIQGIKVLKQILPGCIVFGVEPLIKIHAADDTISPEALTQLNENQFQAMDIMLGRLCPELEGDPTLLDMLGFNYYYSNQWDHYNNRRPWYRESLNHYPLSQLLLSAYRRYGKPILLTETGHFGIDRARWLEEITIECKIALSLGTDLRGICIYPVIDRPDWDQLDAYSNCGIWDLDANKNRVPHYPYLLALEKCKGELRDFW